MNVIARVICGSMLLVGLTSCAQPTTVQVESSAKRTVEDWARNTLKDLEREAQRELERQMETPTRAVPAYDRDEFGPDWYDVDGNSCSTREDQLGQYLTNVVIEADGCTVLAGTLQDNYTARTYEYERGHSVVDLDHIVPLALAWDRGAHRWPDEQRLQFANDPNNLELTYMRANRSKSDRGPLDWMPANAQYHCTYLSNFIQVLRTYDLPVLAGEARLHDEACA